MAYITKTHVLHSTSLTTRQLYDVSGIKGLFVLKVGCKYLLRPTNEVKEMISLVNSTSVNMPNLKFLYKGKTYPIADCHFFCFQIVHNIINASDTCTKSSEMECRRKLLFANHIWLNFRCTRFALRNLDLRELHHSSSLWWFAKKWRPNKAGQSLERVSSS